MAVRHLLVEPPRTGTVREMLRRVLMMVGGAVAALALGIAGGVGYSSLWTPPGASAGGTGGEELALRIDAAAGLAPRTGLYPGGTADLVLRVTNPHDVAVRITGVAQRGEVTVVDGGACRPSNAAVTVPANHSLSVLVPPMTSTDVRLPDAVAMGVAAVEACQGKEFTIPVRLEVSG